MHLVIVESPTKARTIGRFLGSDYQIKASMGHVMDLPKSTLGVDIEHDFAPQYEPIADKREVIKELQDVAKKANDIILATDPDREGEAIASHVKDMLGSSEKLKVKSEKFQRIVFHEITKEAIEEALKNPRSIDTHLVDAQTARRVLDRLVGYKLSPLLWKKVRRGLSAGRVQSVVLRLIVEREREIEKFEKEEYWTVVVLLRQVESAKLKIESGAVEFELVEIDGEKIEKQETFQLYDGEYTVTKTIIEGEKKAQDIARDLQTKAFTVSDVVQKEIRRSPQPPYITSTLQQEASRRLGFSGKRTMALAQKLYEEGLITYHRTDSVTIAKNALLAIRNFVKKEFGEKYLPELPRFYKTKQKLAQEAHEAIRPTKFGKNSKFEIRNSKLGNDSFRLYELIWRRAVASQMSDAVIESMTVTVTAGQYTLKTNGSVLVFEGFLKATPQALMDKKLPQYKVLEGLDLISINTEKHETQPPPRYNDASLVQTLEEKGIGRPSTYAPIISTIESRQYVEKTEGRFIPTTVGVAVNDFLVKNFSEIDDIPFTVEMEDHLDDIARGQKEWVPMIKDFYGPFSQKLEKVNDAPRVKIEVEKTDEKCQKCGSPIVIRVGRFGKFFSCSRFPECDFTRSYVEETQFKCPRCLPAGRQGGIVIIKRTRKGKRFYGCSNYPACNFAAWNLRGMKNT